MKEIVQSEIPTFTNRINQTIIRYVRGNQIVWDGNTPYHQWSELDKDRFRCSLNKSHVITSLTTYTGYWGWKDYDLSGKSIDYKGISDHRWCEGIIKGEIVQRRPIGIEGVDWVFESPNRIRIINKLSNVHFYNNVKIEYPGNPIIDDFRIDKDKIYIITIHWVFKDGKARKIEKITEYLKSEILTKI
jgi:hypothetical protein